MIKIMSASEVRQNFQEVIDSVYYKEESVVVLRRNKPRVIISALPQDDKKIDKAIRDHEIVKEKNK